MKKRIISFVLTMCIFCTIVTEIVPIANASNAYVINGVTVHYDDFASSPSECWAYANAVYKKIWGQNFSSEFGSSDNYLRNLSDSELTLTAAHLKTYVSNAALGSSLRICNSVNLHSHDGYISGQPGHNQIIVQKDENGFTVFEGGLTDAPHRREKYYTWSEYINTGWLGGTYSYIKYIKWPGSTPYSGNVSVRTDKSVYNPGETVTIIPSGENIDHYNLRICYEVYGDDSTVYTDFSGLTGATTFVPWQKGTYIVRISAVASSGNYVDAECTFVVATIPTNVSVRTNHLYDYSVGETVTIIPSGDNVLFYTLRICYGTYGDETTVFLDLDGFVGTKTFIPTEAGKYIVRVSAVGEDGYYTDAECVFYVGAGPTNVSVTTNRAKYSINETVIIYPSGNDVDHYNLRICYEVYGDDSTVYTDFSGLTGSTTYVPEMAGNYIVRISAVNSSGYYTDAECTFYVGAGPSNVSVTTDKLNYDLNETVTIIPSGIGIDHYNLRICYGSYGDDTTVYTDFSGLTSSTTYKPNMEGTYIVRISAVDSEGFYTDAECTFSVEKHVHSYTYAVTAAPTTSATGVLTGTCSKCGGTTTVTLPKLDTTNYTYTVVTAATCTANGTGRYTWKTTTYGTFSFDVTIPKTKHSYTYAVTTKPTTSATGVLTGTCSKCGGTTTVTLPKLNKTDYTYNVIVAATCTANGTGRYTWKTTTYGTFSFDVTIPKTKHSYTYAVTTKPTTSATGVLTGTCSKCGGTTTVTLPKLNKTDYTYNVVVAATCTVNGMGRYTWKTTTYGTFSFDTTIPKAGHCYVDTVKPPACTERGYTTHTCSVCGDSYVDAYTNALGHNYQNGVCTRCGTLDPNLENPFSDVKKSKYFYTPVLWAYYHNPRITGGTGDGKFSPNATCTREQIVTFLWKAYGAPEPQSYDNPFKDVKKSKYYYKAVLWAAEKGITSGVGNGKFGVGQGCTREQAMTFLWVAAGKPGHSQQESAFTDVKKGKYYYNAILWAVENGITSGVGNGKFGVGQTCTRAQIVTFLYALLGK